MKKSEKKTFGKVFLKTGGQYNMKEQICKEEQSRNVAKGVMSSEEFAEFSASICNRFVQLCNIRINRITKDYAQAVVDVSDDLRNTFGRLHGGLLFTLGDTVAGMEARQDGRLYVTQSSNFEYISNVDSGRIYGTGRCVYRGKRMVVVQVEISAEDGKLLAVGTYNMMPTSMPAMKKTVSERGGYSEQFHGSARKSS